MSESNPVILITGGTKGLGLATASAFAAQGARLILTYRSDRANAEAVEKDFRGKGTECHTVEVDLSEENAPDRLFARVKEITPAVSVYVHNAAATAFKPLLEIQPHHIRKTFDITVSSLIRNVQQLVPLMTAGGAIVTVSGMDTREVVPLHGLLGAAKASLEMLTLYLAHELAPKGIRVNGVNPGYLETDSTRKYFGPRFDEINRLCARIAPGGKPARLEDVASVIEFLASPAAQWIVGQTILVDGGQTTACALAAFAKSTAG